MTREEFLMSHRITWEEYKELIAKYNLEKILS